MNLLSNQGWPLTPGAEIIIVYYHDKVIYYTEFCGWVEDTSVPPGLKHSRRAMCQEWCLDTGCHDSDVAAKGPFPRALVQLSFSREQMAEIDQARPRCTIAERLGGS